MAKAEVRAALRSSTKPTDLISISRNLARAVHSLPFSAPVQHVYRVLDYASATHEQYLMKYGQAPKKVVFFGMNPGPFGMMQTGVPFGDVTMVRDFLKIQAPIQPPPIQHEKRQILGFDCPRGEVSGQRLWGFAQSRFGSAARFFEHFFVMNYCPLAFLTETGANFTPDKLPKAEAKPLFDACDAALRQVVDVLSPEFVIGIGTFAHNRALQALPDFSGKIGTILHPSPASPHANRGWAEHAERQLRELGIELPARAS